MGSKTLANRTYQEWLSTLPACLLLFSVVLFSTGSDIHNRLLQLGQHLWSGYYELRTDPVVPECNPNLDIEAEVRRKVAESSSSSDDALGDLFADDPVDPDVIRQSLSNSLSECQTQHARYEQLKDMMSPGVKVFRFVELAIADGIAFGLVSQRYILAIIVLICAATATFTRHHIAMRPMESRLDHTVSYTLQFIANSILLTSVWSFRELTHADGNEVELEREILHNLWIAGFGLVTLVSLVQLFRIPKDAQVGGGLGHALLAVPMYTMMCLISGVYFLIAGHSAGIGIYLDKMMDLSDMFLNVGLFVWIGMLLKQTRLAPLVFALFRPWKMPPEVLAFVVVVVAALPTAYTGASGVFVIAAGAVIYSELTRAGARRQLALAATAMSGSLGVVLRPCLMVVAIAYLNRSVTTDDLFGWGAWVFMLTAGLFLMVSLLLNRQSKITFAPASEAFPEMVERFKPIIPYILIFAGIILFYDLVLDVGLHEFSAPRILPVMMLGVLVYEHFTFKSSKKSVSAEIDHQGFEKSVRTATNETTAEIGALLLLMGLSVSIGGVIERSGLMEMFPESFASAWSAMFLLVVVLIILGMIMDPFGAIILVSATIATIGYESGIHPIHFWMVALVAFELGYLSPPVALNHLLTRQVVGEREVELAKEEAAGGTFYQRHEKIVMPLITMGIALVIVAFGPLLVYAK